MGLQERERKKRIKKQVIDRDGLICCYCDKTLTLKNVTMEHIVPESKKGTFNSTNLTIACYKCNNRRGNESFFDYIKNLNFDENKLNKYKKMYFNNLRIKILNIAKEECMSKAAQCIPSKEESQQFVPIELIEQACKILKIKNIDFSDYENKYEFEIKFYDLCEKKKIKFCFEIIIKLLELDSM